jgi:hypothetical protein
MNYEIRAVLEAIGIMAVEDRGTREARIMM